MMDEALGWKNQEKYDQAAAVLRKVVRAFPRYAGAAGLLGQLYFSIFDNPKQALPLFRRAVRLSPSSERASLGLFHSLWRLDRLEEALEEMKRYQLLTNWSCQDYREIMEEIGEKWLTPPKPGKTRKKEKNAG